MTQLSEVDTLAQENAARPRPRRGGVVTWACRPGFPPSAIFPFTPPERFGLRNPYEFQMLMYRPLYWLGKDGGPEVDYDLSLGRPPVWSEDGRTVSVTLKPWKWSNGETVSADNVMFWVNMLAVKGPRYGGYAPGYFPDNLTSYEKVSEDTVSFTFDRAYAKTWVLMNQLTLITPMPKTWDRTADDVPANASADLRDVPAVYDYLLRQNGAWTEEGNETRTRWASSPVWSVVNGPWRLKSYTLDGVVTFVPNEHYSGPGRPYLDEFRQVPIVSDEEEYGRLASGPDGPDGIQVGYLPYGLGTEQIVDGRNPLADQYRLVPQNACSIRLMPVNHDNPNVAGRMLRQAYVRQALQHALDQDGIIRNIFHGYAYRTDGPVPRFPDSPYLSPTQRRHPLQFDIDRARTLLASHGWDVSTTPAVCVRPGTGAGCAGDGISAGDTLSFSLRYAAGDVALDRLVHQLAADAGPGRPRTAAAGGARLDHGGPGSLRRAAPGSGNCTRGTAAGPTTASRPARWCSRPTRAATSVTTATRGRMSSSSRRCSAMSPAHCTSTRTTWPARYRSCGRRGSRCGCSKSRRTCTVSSLLTPTG